MRYIFNCLKEYITANFNGRLYLTTLIWVVFLLSFNFYYDFEDSFIDSFYGSYIRIILMFLIHAISYYVVCWFIYLFTDTRQFVKNREFWFVSIAGFAILAWDRGNSLSKEVADVVSEHIHTYLFVFKTAIRWLHVVTLILPLYLFYRLYQKKTVGHFYGLNKRNINLRPYFVMLMVMVPIIALASLHPSFLKQYPNFKSAGIDQFSNYMNLNGDLVTTIYEIGYSLGFLTVELFFRGFLIFGLVRYLGSAVVLPMAVTYCVLHFGKPLGEAISSLFGGYILGTIALKTENIYGGVIVHIGIAWLMELFAYIQL